MDKYVKMIISEYLKDIYAKLSDEKESNDNKVKQQFIFRLYESLQEVKTNE